MNFKFRLSALNIKLESYKNYTTQNKTVNESFF